MPCSSTIFDSIAGQRVAMDSGTLSYRLTDHLGSLVAATDAGGQLVDAVNQVDDCV